jgi:hypothetical protein
MPKNTTDVFDNIKEKLSNPLVFTYFWVFCSIHHKELLILFFEPKLFSNKLKFLQEPFAYLIPLLATIVALLLLPWLNNIVELWRQKAQRFLEVKLDKWGWVPMVKAHIHKEKLEEIESLGNKLYNEQKITKSQQIEIDSNEERTLELKSEYNQKLKDVKEVIAELASSQKRVKELEEELSSEQTRNNISPSLTEKEKSKKPNDKPSKVKEVLSSSKLVSNVSDITANKENTINTAHEKNIKKRDLLLSQHKRIQMQNRVTKAKSNESNESNEYVVVLPDNTEIVLPNSSIRILELFSESPDSVLSRSFESPNFVVKLADKIITKAPINEKDNIEDMKIALKALLDEDLMVEIGPDKYKLSDDGILLAFEQNPKYISISEIDKKRTK